MRKIICILLVCLVVFGNPCVHATAIEQASASYGSGMIGILATEAFGVSISPYGEGQANKAFSLEAGETVRIYATFSPRDAGIVAGLVDSDGIFYYDSASNGIVDLTIRIEKSGEYRFAVVNNSGHTVSISGYVYY